MPEGDEGAAVPALLLVMVSVSRLGKGKGGARAPEGGF